MTTNEADLKMLEFCCRGNREAMGFLDLWREYVHQIDDQMDGDLTDKEGRLGTFALAILIYTDPFFIKNMRELRQIAINCTNAYADTLAWEDSEKEWQRNFADHYRHFGAEMVLAVAGICGGYGHMRAISLELRTICWCEHHTKEGKAV